jgi:hypothetical protein
MVYVQLLVELSVGEKEGFQVYPAALKLVMKTGFQVTAQLLAFNPNFFAEEG